MTETGAGAEGPSVELPVGHPRELSVFISYRREDSAAYAGRLADSLVQRFGRNGVFMDIDTIDPGVDYKEVIERHVGRCDVLIVLIGPRWITTSDSRGRRLDNPHDLVRQEIESALQRNIRVIPALVGGTEMPHADELPGGLSLLARRQAIELSDKRFRVDVEFLIEKLAGIAGEEAIPIEAQRAESLRSIPAVPVRTDSTAALVIPSAPGPRVGAARTWSRPGRRTLILGAAAAVTVAAVVATSVLLSPPGAAKFTFASVQEGTDLSAIRTWTLSSDGRTLTGTLDFANSSSDARKTTHIEVIRKSLAASTAGIKFSLPAPEVVLADPVVRYSLTIPAHSTLHASYVIGVRALGSSTARVNDWVNDQRTAAAVFTASAGVTTPSPSASPTHVVTTPKTRATTAPTVIRRPSPTPTRATPKPPPPNRPPVANHEYFVGTYALNCAYAWHLNVLLNDTDPDNNALTVTGVSLMYPMPGYQGLGSVHIVGNDVYYYPPTNFQGTDYGYFGYYIKDGKGGTASVNDEIEIIC